MATPGPASTSPAAPTAGVHRYTYGSDPSQYGELYVPSGPVRQGVVVVIHGGYWSEDYGLELGTALAADLAKRGWVAWNIEYRRIGDGGGWPGTFADVAAAVDLLATLGLDLSRVVAIGHSAGGQLAVWAAGRHTLPAAALGAAPRVRVHGVVSQAGVLDLVTASAQGLGGTAVSDLMGGTPAEVPARYAIGDPVELVPIGVPVRCVHSATDGVVPLSQSQQYIAAATKVGDDATLIPVTGDHFALINVDSSAWRAVVALVPSLISG